MLTHRIITIFYFSVKAWRLQKSQKRIGMPIYIASGSFTDVNTNTKYRFLVLPRYDIDLQKIIARGRTLDLRNTLVLAIQILDVLEYLHKQGYTHSDIKSSNLMLGFDGSKIFKQPSIKPPPSFQKETKELAVLSGKQKRPKTTKSRTNYYEDEDYVLKGKSSSEGSEEETSDKSFHKVKKTFRNILSDKHHRTLHRHHAFNLRQLSNYVNYEDLNSVCSDESYQLNLVDKKKLRYSSDEGFHSDQSKTGKKNIKTTMPPPMSTEITITDIFKEAIISQSNGQIYLLDYGLASRFMDSKGNHKDFGMDARKAHDGTLEYSSRDSHIGAHSRRSDLETLGYNLIDWLTGTLPWKTTEMLAEPDLVHALKKNYMSDVKSLLRTCFKTENYPQFMEKYLQYITSLDFTEKPDYDYCRNIFRNEFIKNGFGTDKDIVLDFSESPMSPMVRKKLLNQKRFGKKNPPPKFLSRSGIRKPFGRENICSLENNLKLELMKQTLNSSSDGVRKPCASRNFFISDAELIANLKKSLMPQEIFGKKLSPKNLRSNKRNIKRRKGKRSHRSSIGKFGNFMGSARQFTWAEILAGNPEDIIRKERNTTIEPDCDDDEDNCKYRIRKLSNASDNSSDSTQSPLMQKDYLLGLNPTYAMKEVFANFKKKMSGKQTKEDEEECNKVEGCTPVMVKLIKSKEIRKAKEEQEKKIINDKNKCKAEIENTRVTRSAKMKLRTKSTTSNVTSKKQVCAKKKNNKTKSNPTVVLHPYKEEPEKNETKIKNKENVKKTKEKEVVTNDNTTKVTTSPKKGTQRTNKKSEYEFLIKVL